MIPIALRVVSIISATVNSKPAKAGEFSSGAFQPFAKYANGDRRAR
jgi:hypothetical protein